LGIADSIRLWNKVATMSEEVGMTVTGGCRCGAVRYEADGEPEHSALCGCEECRRSSGAFLTGWALFPRDRVTVTGTPASHNSSGDVERHFCATCGTGLFFLSETAFPGKIDIQTASLDDPEALPPQACIQMADAPRWMEGLDALPKFARYPG
jgi:hypothetical protein